MSGRRRSLLTAREGIATLEFALVAPVFLLVIFLVFEVGMLMWANSAIQAAASQTARCTALDAPACADSKAFATSLINGWGVAGVLPSVSVTVQPDTTCNTATGRFSTVTITGTPSGLVSLASFLPNLVLTSTACYPNARNVSSETGS